MGYIACYMAVHINLYWKWATLQISRLSYSQEGYVVVKSLSCGGRIIWFLFSCDEPLWNVQTMLDVFSNVLNLLKLEQNPC